MTGCEDSTLVSIQIGRVFLFKVEVGMPSLPLGVLYPTAVARFTGSLLSS